MIYTKFAKIIILLLILLSINGCNLFVLHKLVTIAVPESAGFIYSNTDDYYHDSFVTLSASNYQGYIFKNWEINGTEISTENPLILKMDSDKTVKAYFVSTDNEKPIITLFEAPASTTEKGVNIFLAGSDNTGIAGWMITESPDIPNAASSLWDTLKPTYYHFNRPGSVTLFAWIKDTNNNISDYKSINIMVIDNDKPVIEKFLGPALTAEPGISLSLSWSDNFDIIYWLVKESPDNPPANYPSWQLSESFFYTLTHEGISELYAWIKDYAGNISESKKITVNYDAIKPEITMFTAPETTASFLINVSLSGSDNRAVTGWLLTNNAEKPTINSSGWYSTKPTTYNLPSHDNNVVYAWAKDEAGNISNPASVTVKKSFSGSWTIMVWMDADNNLEFNAMTDLNEMEYGLYEAKQADPDIEDKLAVVVQVDRIDGWDSSSHDDGPDWTDARRYWMRAHTNPFVNEKITSNKLSELGEVSMGDASELKKFIEYCRGAFPAEHYGLIFWNHGGGVRNLQPGANSAANPVKWICRDDTNNRDMLYVGEITRGLTDSEDVAVLGFDACSMGMLEIAYEYRPLDNKFGAGYMVASPAFIQADGWEYDRIINRLKGIGSTDSDGDVCYDIETLTGEQLAGVFVKEYGDAFKDLAPELMVAFDLSQVETVKTNLDAISGYIRSEKAIYEPLRGNLNNPGTILNYFDERYSDQWLDIPHFDLYDFAEFVRTETENWEAGWAAVDLKESVNSFVIASWAGADYINFIPGINGAGFFYPDGNHTFASQYWYTEKDIFRGTEWLCGNLDFCNTNGSGDVESWKELLEFWYDPSNTITPLETW